MSFLVKKIKKSDSTLEFGILVGRCDSTGRAKKVTPRKNFISLTL